MESEEVLSKSIKNRGKPMVKVKLCVHGKDFDVHVYDYFADWFSEWKLKHFCESVGIEDDYQNGEVDPTRNAWQGKEGFVDLRIEEASGNYSEKNTVEDYKEDNSDTIEEKPAKAEKAPAPAPGPGVTTGEDDVPF